jgi:hypothetical protein
MSQDSDWAAGNLRSFYGELGDLSFRHSVQIDPGAHSTSPLTGTEISSPRGKTAGAWC